MKLKIILLAEFLTHNYFGVSLGNVFIAQITSSFIISYAKDADIQSRAVLYWASSLFFVPLLSVIVSPLLVAVAKPNPITDEPFFLLAVVSFVSAMLTLVIAPKTRKWLSIYFLAIIQKKK